jgi:hypothetical protein
MLKVNKIVQHKTTKTITKTYIVVISGCQQFIYFNYINCSIFRLIGNLGFKCKLLASAKKSLFNPKILIFFETKQLQQYQIVT